MTKRLIPVIAALLIIGTTVACTKKEDPALAALAALQAQMQEMQAELEKARSGNATAEEIAKIETAIAQIAEQEQQAEQRTTAPSTTTTTATTPAATANTTTTPTTTTTAPSTSTTTTTPSTATPAASTSTTTAPASTSTTTASTGRALVIPDGTTAIAEQAYGWERSIGYTSVIIPGSVTTIGDSAFVAPMGGGTITSVTIGNGVREIGIAAFAGQKITSVTIPTSVTTIGGSAFASNQLTGHLTIPNSVTSLGRGAFKDNKLTGVTLPNGITTIEGMPYDGVFWSNQITSVTIPDSVTSIGQYAFADNRITSLTFGRNVREIGENAFDGHYLTGSLVIPNSVTTIGVAAFRGYAGNNITSLTIGNNVTSIGANAFCWLNLTSVTIPASVRTIGYWAFHQLDPQQGRNTPITRVTFEGDGVRLEAEQRRGDVILGNDGPFDGNLHQVYNGRGTYLRGSDGNWTKRVETPTGITTNTSLHAEPSASARVIRSINAGQVVSVLHNTIGTSSIPITAADSAGQSWTQVVYGGDEGWVRSDYLSGR